MKSILLFMIFIVCQLEGKKFLQDNFKVDYNYY
ncbi:phospholipase, partial [Helicobacter pylori]|nr:phospholipase [Helicobacter pylori]MDO7866660.1 phospholipase [Helicobacter pylori]